MAHEEKQDSATAVEEADAAPDLKEIIGIAVADAGVLRKSLTVTVPSERIKEERDKQYSELINDAIVPGFRKGHAPRKLVEKRFGNEVGDQVLTKLVSNAYMAAIEKQGLKALGDPMFRLATAAGEETTDTKASDRLVDFRTALDEIKLPNDGPLVFTCEVEVKPDFELPPLDGIPVSRPNVKITDEDVTKQIDRIRQMQGEFVPVPDGTVETDDLVVVDLKMTVGDEVVKQQENATVPARATRIEGVTLEGLGEALKGARAGDVRTSEGKIPDDAEREDLRGKAVRFEFKVNDIKRMRLPPIDQAFLSGQGFDNEPELRNAVRGQMERRLSQEITRGMRGQIYQYLLDRTKLDLPEGLSARQVDRAVIRKLVELRRQGYPMSEIEKHADELRTGAREQALTELKSYFILEKIAESLNVDVSEEEINSQIAAMARHYGQRFDRMRDELAKEEGLENLYLQIRDEKCVDRLLEKATISETTGPATSMSELAETT